MAGMAAPHLPAAGTAPPRSPSDAVAIARAVANVATAPNYLPDLCNQIVCDHRNMQALFLQFNKFVANCQEQWMLKVCMAWLHVYVLWYIMFIVYIMTLWGDGILWEHQHTSMRDYPKTSTTQHPTPNTQVGHAIGVLMRMHSQSEMQALYPLVENMLPEGKQLADKARQEHQVLETVCVDDDDDGGGGGGGDT